MTSAPPSRTVLVTGASNGLGAAIALHQAREGTRLVLIARNEDRLAAVAAGCRARGAETTVAAIDVRDADRLARFVRDCDAQWTVDAVFANAGIEASLAPDGSSEPLGVALDQLHTNLDGVVATVSPLLDPMRRRGQGLIVLVSSLAALVPLPDQPAYCASKAAVLAWGDALVPWLAAAGVHLAVACPGFVRTGMSDNYQGWRPFEWSAERAARHICRKAAAGRKRILFPAPLAGLVLLGRSVPRPIRDWVVARFFHFNVRSGD